MDALAVAALAGTKNEDILNGVTGGETALHQAVRSSSGKLVDELLRNPGVDVHAKDSAGFTPLHIALGGKPKLELVTRLLTTINAGEMGSESRTSIYGDVVLHHLTAAHPSAFEARDYEKTIIGLLLRSGFDIDQRSENGRTLLHVASKFNFAVAVKALLVCKLDVNARDIFGRTPLDLSCDWNVFSTNQPVLELLIDHGADAEKGLREKVEWERLRRHWGTYLTGFYWPRGTHFAPRELSGKKLMFRPTIPQQQKPQQRSVRSPPGNSGGYRCEGHD